MSARGELEMDRLSYLSDEQAWVRALDYAVHAEMPETFKKRLAAWLPFFPDAAKAIDMPDRAVQATVLCKTFHTPWGAIVIQLAEQDA